MDRAPHSSRIKLGALEDHVPRFEIPIWNLKIGFQDSVRDGETH